MRAARALHRRRERQASGRHLVEGPNAVGEAVDAGVVEVLFHTEAAGALADALLVGRTDASIERVAVADHVLEHLADAATPQGVVAVARTPHAQLADLPSAGEPIVVLAEVADPGNAGTILRSADALGAAGVVLTAGSVDAFSPKAVRAAAGGSYHLPVVTGVSIEEVAVHARARGRLLAGLDAGGTQPLTSLRTDGRPVTLVLGNEAHGLPAAVIAELDALVSIALHPRAESLNVAAAAAIAIHAASTLRPPDPDEQEG